MRSSAPGPGQGRSLQLRTAAASEQPCVLSVLQKGHLTETSVPSKDLGAQGDVVPPNPDPDGDRGVPKVLGASRTDTSGSSCTGAGSGDLVPFQSHLCALSPACAVLASGHRVCGPGNIGRQRRRPP